MHITSILAVLDGDSGTEAVLSGALTVGRALGATVECLHVESAVADSLPMLVEVGSGAAVKALLEADRQERERRREHVEAVFKRTVAAAEAPTFSPNGAALPTGFGIGLRTVVGHAGREIAARGRLFDLIVIGRPEQATGGIDAPDFEATLFDTARPVLIIDGQSPEIVELKAMVAWDGSREAALALAMAIPLLTLAASVEVLTIEGKGGDAPDPAAAAQFLARHGIRAEARRLEMGNRTPADVLVDACRDGGAGLLVMGAYGHSPLGEYIFGGVTRRALEKSPTPILLAH